MNTISDLDQLTLRTRRREFEDGMFDFVLAVSFLLLALLNWLVFSGTGLRWLLLALQWNRELTIMGLLALILLYFLLVMGARALINRIRYQTLWKDSGGVKPLRWQVHWSVSLAACMGFIIVLFAALVLMGRGVIDQPAVLRMFVAGTGVAMGIICFGMGLSLGMGRYRWVGAAGLLLSAVLPFLPLSFASSWLVVGLIWTVVLGLSGSWALRKSLDAAKGG